MTLRHSALLSLFVLGGLIVNEGAMAGPPAGPLDASALEAMLDPIFDETMADEHVPGAVISVVRDGAIVFAKGYGVADLDSHKPVRPDTTLFRIGSTSKAITSLAVLQAIDRGSLALDGDVNDYVTAFAIDDRFGEPVRVRHLLAHTGGFDQLGSHRVFFRPGERPGLAEFLQRDLHRIRPPGRMACYDTYGMSLAGYLLEATSGVDFATYMKREVFEPLGMTRTWVEAPANRRAELAVGYGFADGTYTVQPYELYATLPASSIDSTATDMAQLMIAVLGDGSNAHGRLFSMSAARRLAEPVDPSHPHMPKFSWGFWEEFRDGQRIINHGGTMRGYSSLLYLLPADGLGIFVACNRDVETGPPTQLVYTVARRLVDAWYPGDGGAAEAAPRERLDVDTARFAGAYISNLYCHTCFEGEGWNPSEQVIRFSEAGPGEISTSTRTYHAVEPLLFTDDSGQRALLFSEDTAGQIIGLSINLYAPGTTFEKMDDRLIEEVAGDDWRNGPVPPIAAIVYRVNERWAEAARAYDDLVVQAPEDSMARAGALYHAGACRLEMDDPAGALSRLGESKAGFLALAEADDLTGTKAKAMARETSFLQLIAATQAGDIDASFAIIDEAIDVFGVPVARIVEELREGPQFRALFGDPRFKALEQAAAGH